MNPTNKQELDEILTKLENAVALNIGSQGMRGEAPKRSHWKAKAAIQAHTNAEIAKVLERLESELNEQKKAAETNLAYHTDVTKNERLIRDWQGTVHGIEFCRPAIAAERAKLKEVK